jgi:hypothetical protein
MAKESEGSKAAGAGSWIRHLVDEGLNNTRITGFLRQSGLSYRNQTMLQDINRYRLSLIHREDIRGLGPGEKVRAEQMSPMKTPFPPIEPFRTLIAADWRNASTGEITSLTRTFHHRTEPSQNDALGAAEAARERYLESDGLELVSITSIEYYKVEYRP